MLGTLALTAILIHVSFFITAVFLRSGHFPIALLLPRFSEGYYNGAVSIGLLGFWLTIIVIISGALSRKAQRVSKRVHRLSYAAFGLSFIHGLLIGSETRAEVTSFFYNGLAISLVIVMLIRFKASLAFYAKNLRVYLSTLIVR